MAVEVPLHIRKHIDMFTGRTWLLPKLQMWLREHNEPVFLITGLPGVGKSMLAAWLAGFGPAPANPAAAAQLAQVRATIRGAHFCISGASVAPQDVIGGLARRLTETLPGFGQALLASNGREVQITINQHAGSVSGSMTGVAVENLVLGDITPERAISQLLVDPLRQLYAAGYNTRVVLLVDALDEAETFSAEPKVAQLLAGLRNRPNLPPQVRILATTRPDPRVMAYFKPLPRESSLDLLDNAPATVDDIARYAQERLAGLDADRRTMLAQKVAAKARGIFLYAHLVLEDLRARPPAPVEAETLELPRDLSDLYLQFLLREIGAEERWYTTYYPVLGLIAVAQGEGLSRAQLQSILGKMRSEVEPAVRACAQYLAGSVPDGPFRPFHQSFAEFLLDDEHNTDRHIDAAEMHSLIANYYLKTYKDEWQTCDSYGLRYLAVHLIRAGQGETLRRLLFTFDWLQSKLATSDVNVIIDDYKLLPEDKDLRVIQETIQLAGHILTQDKTQLAGQLLGRLISSQNVLIQSMLKDAKDWRTTRWWLRPLTQSLEPAGGPLLRNIPSLGGIPAIVLTPDGKKLVSAHSDFGENTLRVWDMESGEMLHILTSHTSVLSLMAVAVTPDGKLAISGSLNGVLEFWDIQSGKPLRALENYHEGIMGIVITPTWTIVSLSVTGNLRVWNLKRRPPLVEEWDLGGSMGSMALTPDGKRVVFWSWNFVLPNMRNMPARPQTKTGLTVWDIQSDRESYILTEEDVKAVAVTPDGSQAISLSEEGTLTIWDLHSKSKLRTLTGQGKAAPPVIVTPDGKLVLSAAENHTILGWDLTSGEQRFTLRGHTASISALAVTPDGQRAVSAGDGTLKVWSLQSQEQQQTSTAHMTAVTAVAIMPDGQRTVSVSTDGTLHVWRLASGERLHTLWGLPTLLATIVSMDNEHIIAISNDGTQSMWSVASGEQLPPLPGPSAPHRATTITPDGRWLAGIDDKALQVWELQKSKAPLHSLLLQAQPAPPIERIEKIAVTPDGKQVITAYHEGPMLVWSLESGALLHQLTTHAGVFSAIGITPDSTRAVSLDRTEGTILKVWDLQNGQQLHSLQGHTNTINAIVITGDSKCVISVSDDYTLKVWDLTSGECITGFSGDSPLLACAVAVDGLTIVAGDKAGQVHFLHMEEPGTGTNVRV
jgi:WD40 repeat protein